MPSNISLASDQNWISSQIGGNQYRFVMRLIEGLLGWKPTFNEIDASIAPSIMARSECELLSVSAPRFAIRMELPDGSLIHLRRLAFMQDACEHIKYTSNGIEKDISNALINNLKHDGSAIADSSLVPPRHLRSGEWHVLTSSLSDKYAHGHAGQVVRGTPFLRQLYFLGGGMCAQAACFMANAILLDHSRSLFGVAEITALMSIDAAKGKAARVSIRGMSAKRTLNYFRSPQVGLNAFVHTREISTLGHVGSQSRNEYLANLCLSAIRSYVLSGCPVIVHFDYRLLSDATSYSDIKSLLEAPTKRQPHAIVVVGCGKGIDSPYVVNDPSHLPFRELTHTEMRHACGLSSVSTSKSEVFIACTPAGVHLPLLQQGCQEDGSIISLQLLLEQCAQSENELYRDMFSAAAPALQASDTVRLIDKTAAGASWAHTICRDNALPASVVGRLSDWLKGIDGQHMGWLWVIHRRVPASEQQRFSEWLMLVDASTVITKGDAQVAYERLPVLALCCSAKTNEWTMHTLGVRRVQLSTTTSYSTRQLSLSGDAISQIDMEPTVEGVEPYILMQSDVRTRRHRKIAEKYGFDKQYQTSVDYMAECGKPGNESAMQEAIAAVVDTAPRQLPVVSLATFIPSVSLPPQSDGAEAARNALRFAIHLGASWWSTQDEAGVEGLPRRMVIEIVAGSRVTGLTMDDNGQGSMLANYAADESTIENFLANIEKTLEQCEGCLEKIVMAVELEPGPLFTINTIDTMIDLCEKIDRNPSLRKVTGLNLDIAHARMNSSDTTTSDASESARKLRNSVAFNRIVHAHISGHDTKAHFGDKAIDKTRVDEYYGAWLAMLRSRAAVRDSLVPYSGYVSLELEAMDSSRQASAEMRQLSISLAAMQGNQTDGLA